MVRASSLSPGLKEGPARGLFYWTSMAATPLLIAECESIWTDGTRLFSRPPDATKAGSAGLRDCASSDTLAEDPMANLPRQICVSSRSNRSNLPRQISSYPRRESSSSFRTSRTADSTRSVIFRRSAGLVMVAPMLNRRVRPSRLSLAPTVFLSARRMVCS